MGRLSKGDLNKQQSREGWEETRGEGRETEQGRGSFGSTAGLTNSSSVGSHAVTRQEAQLLSKL